MRETVLSLIRYGAVGASAALAHFLVAAGLSRLGVLLGAAGAAGFVVGFIISVLGHRNFTFRSNQALSAVTLRMAGLAGVGLAYNAVAAPLAAQAGLPSDLAIATAVATTPLINYAAMRFWVFRT